jgi:hypothetical protein
MAEEVSTQTQIDELRKENQILSDKNATLEIGLKDLQSKFAAFISGSSPVTSNPVSLKIPDKEFPVDVDGETIKVVFQVPKFRIHNNVELTALEASTDKNVMEMLIRSKSGVIRIVD